MDKKALRERYFREFRAFKGTPESADALSEIQKRLLEFFSQRRNVNRVMAYQPMPSELPVLDLMNDLPFEYFSPVINGDFLLPQSLISGIVQKISDMDFIIVPGLYITCEGFRLGRGRGFYDRLLCDYPVEQTLFIGYDWQVLPQLPLDEWDKPVGYCITEKRIQRFFV